LNLLIMGRGCFLVFSLKRFFIFEKLALFISFGLPAHSTLLIGYENYKCLTS